MNIIDSNVFGKITYDLEKTKIDDIFEIIKPYAPEVINISQTNLIEVNSKSYEKK